MKERRFLSSEQAAQYLLFPNVGAFYDFMHHRRKAGFPVRTHRRGRRLLFTEADLDAVLYVEESRHARMRKVVG